MAYTYYNGDKESFIDSYRRFIDVYLPTSINSFINKNKGFVRFYEKSDLEQFLKTGVHKFFTSNIYKMLFRRNERDVWDKQSKRDKEIEQYFHKNQKEL